MLQGSGPADRDADGYFPPIRDAFLQRDVAVYSHDKPGIGASSGDWRDFALFDRADQAQAAIATLKDQPDIDPQRVGVWGHSQGAWIVQIVASRVTELAFAITSSGPGISPREQDLYGVEHTMRADGNSAEHVERAIALVRALHDAAARGDDYATVARVLLEPAKNQPWSAYHTLDTAEHWSLLCRVMAEQYEPAEALARVRCPFLAIFGELDLLVPAHKSAAICGQALRESASQDVTVVLFPRGNHRILLPNSKEFAPGYLDLLADWTARR
jgi:pimeloyl-ACP methyl ester carboxylesterase